MMSTAGCRGDCTLESGVSVAAGTFDEAEASLTSWMVSPWSIRTRCKMVLVLVLVLVEVPESLAVAGQMVASAMTRCCYHFVKASGIEW